MLWGSGLSVQMRGKPFPVWGSHNNIKIDILERIYDMDLEQPYACLTPNNYKTYIKLYIISDTLF